MAVAGDEREICHVAPTDEERQDAKGMTLLIVEQPMTPRDDAVDRTMPLGMLVRSSREQRERSVELVEQISRSEQPRTRGCELDAERETVDTRADAIHVTHCGFAGRHDTVDELGA